MEKLIIRKKDLVDEVYDILPDTTKGTIKTVIDALVEVLKDDVSHGHSILFQEFGKFSTRVFEANLYNVRSGVTEPKVFYKIYFKASPQLKSLMMENYSYEIEKNDQP